MNLVALPAFTDNYIWMLHDGERAVVVDPGDSAPVLSALAQWHLSLAAILVTHHHHDHIGGVDALRPHLQGAVWGPAREAIPAPYQPLQQGNQIDVLGLKFKVLDVPGHTAGHIAYMQAQTSAAPILFCGDTLFSAGCGRLFEGTPGQMSASLAALADGPDDTLVCCTHEYTLSNLRFAALVEPGNADIALHTQRCNELRAHHQPTLPSTLGLERQINPFLRCTQPAVVAAARAHGAANDDAVDVLAALREWKNNTR